MKTLGNCAPMSQAVPICDEVALVYLAERAADRIKKGDLFSTITPETQTRAKVTMPNMRAVSPASMPDCAFATWLFWDASCLGSCVGYRVSMNCSILGEMLADERKKKERLFIVNREEAETYLGASHANVEIVGVLRVVLLLNLANISLEHAA